MLEVYRVLQPSDNSKGTYQELPRVMVQGSGLRFLLCECMCLRTDHVFI